MFKNIPAIYVPRFVAYLGQIYLMPRSFGPNLLQSGMYIGQKVFFKHDPDVIKERVSLWDFKQIMNGQKEDISERRSGSISR